MNLHDRDWERKGATLSDKTARQQYGLTQDEIYAAIGAGKARHGNDPARPAAIRGVVADLGDAGDPLAFRPPPFEVESLVETCGVLKIDLLSRLVPHLSYAGQFLRS